MIIGLSGYAQSGKDTVAQILCDYYGFKRLAFADGIRNAIYELNPLVSDGVSVKDIVDKHGWDRAKVNYPEIRRLLQVFGTEVGRNIFGSDVWIHLVFKQIQSTGSYVITDVRFPNEGDRIKQRGGYVWRINRHNLSAVNDHVSEHAMDNYLFHKVIYNDGTREDLFDSVAYLFKQMRYAKAEFNLGQ